MVMLEANGDRHEIDQAAVRGDQVQPSFQHHDHDEAEMFEWFKKRAIDMADDVVTSATNALDRAQQRSLEASGNRHAWMYKWVCALCAILLLCLAIRIIKGNFLACRYIQKECVKSKRKRVE
jgi:hypothetical protein